MKLVCCIEAFLQKLTKKTCHLCQKSVFLIKLSIIQLNLAFLLYWSMFTTEINKKNLSFRTKKVFFSSNSAICSYTKLFCYFEEFLQKLTKKKSFMSKKVFFLPNWARYSYTKLFRCFEVFFFRNWQRTCHLGSVFPNKLKFIDNFAFGSRKWYLRK